MAQTVVVTFPAKLGTGFGFLYLCVLCGELKYQLLCQSVFLNIPVCNLLYLLYLFLSFRRFEEMGKTTLYLQVFFHGSFWGGYFSHFRDLAILYFENGI